MTIDEVIAKYKEITSTDSICPGHCNISCDKCMQESKQIAEWLEELKCYKNDNDFSDYADRLHKIAFNSGYNKAIDDFVKAIVDRGLSANDDKYCITHYDNYLKVIKEIAEQLKVGGSNGNL